MLDDGPTAKDHQQNSALQSTVFLGQFVNDPGFCPEKIDRAFGMIGKLRKPRWHRTVAYRNRWRN